MFENIAPRTLKIWLIAAAVIYFLMPFDLIPDLLGLPGRVDDLGVMALFAWFFRNHVKQYAARFLRGAGEKLGEKQGASQRASSPGKPVFDPYRVLGLEPSASGEAIQSAYRERMKEYHPDKVAHLGRELQELAHEKSQDIQRAYRELAPRK